MPLSYVDKITGVSRKFDDNQNEFVISYKSNFNHIWDALVDIFTLGSHATPDEVVQRLRSDPRQYLTGWNHDRGFGRVIVNPDVPTATPGIVHANLVARKADKTIFDFANAFLEPAGSPNQRTVYFVPGGFVIQLTPTYLASGDPNGSDFLSKNGLEEPETPNQTRGLFQLRLPVGKPLQQAIADFNAMTEVLYAEPMYCGFADQMITPNEPYYSTDLWGVKKIQTVNAWNRVPPMPTGGKTGNTKVKIAVVDTGVKNKHQDLGDYLIGSGCIEFKPLL